ncbi:MAG: hypothetical protein J6F30_14405 [Cellulosilyticum sp.]|nr:hypothetical protein [Cellulosilyticum sp.]
MELKLFGFIDEVLQELDDRRLSLVQIAEEIEFFFEELLMSAEKGFLNINSRVKSSKSLKEKIIRNQYYQKYNTKEMLFKHLPDVIGVRIECRFIQDETDLYKFIKRTFNERSEQHSDFYRSSQNQNIFLNLGMKQPQEQKNGMKIFRIDGKYVDGNEQVNFELQIKSLVNVFWGEIEHKVIYKNFNYVIADQFYKDIMKSIKTSLSTIDQQLLLISNQFEQVEDNSFVSQEKQMEKMLAKVVYDIFAKRMKDSIGVLVDFKKSCEAIVRYVFRDALNKGNATLDESFLCGFEKVRCIDEDMIDFTQKLEFEEEPQYENNYIRTLGKHIEARMNEEFQWNLFFRILFAIEPENNCGDFENFLTYYMNKLYFKINRSKLNSNFTNDETKEILEEILQKYAECFVSINTVELLYDNMVDQVVKHINSIVESIYKNVLTYEEWENEKQIYLSLLEVRLYMMFNLDIESDKVLSILDGIRATKSNVEVPKGMIKYIYKLG